MQWRQTKPNLQAPFRQPSKLRLFAIGRQKGAILAENNGHKKSRGILIGQESQLGHRESSPLWLAGRNFQHSPNESLPNGGCKLPSIPREQQQQQGGELHLAG